MLEVIIYLILGAIIGGCFAGYWWIVRLGSLEERVGKLSVAMMCTEEEVVSNTQAIAINRHEIEEIRDTIRSKD